MVTTVVYVSFRHFNADICFRFILIIVSQWKSPQIYCNIECRKKKLLQWEYNLERVGFFNMSKNNVKEYVQKMQPQHQRYTLKKLTVGVASVLIGTTTYLASSDAVHADTVNSNAGSADVNQETNATIDTHEVDVSSSSSDSASSANVQSGDRLSSVGSSNAAQSVDSLASSTVSQLWHAVSSVNESNTTSVAVASQSAKSQESVADNSVQKFTVNTAELNTSSVASQAMIAENKVSVSSDSTDDSTLSQAELHAGSLIDDRSQNYLAFQTGTMQTVGLRDGSTLTIDNNIINAKHPSTVLTFKSSSFKAGDKYTILIPHIYLDSANDVASLQPAFGSTTVESLKDIDGHVYWKITDKFINSGTITQSIKLTRRDMMPEDLNTWFKDTDSENVYRPFDLITGDIQLVHNDERQSLTMNYELPDYTKSVNDKYGVKNGTFNAPFKNGSKMVLQLPLDLLNYWGKDAPNIFGSAHSNVTLPKFEFRIRPSKGGKLPNISTASVGYLVDEDLNKTMGSFDIVGGVDPDDSRFMNISVSNLKINSGVRLFDISGLNQNCQLEIPITVNVPDALFDSDGMWNGTIFGTVYHTSIGGSVVRSTVSLDSQEVKITKDLTFSGDQIEFKRTFSHTDLGYGHYQDDQNNIVNTSNKQYIVMLNGFWYSGASFTYSLKNNSNMELRDVTYSLDVPDGIAMYSSNFNDYESKDCINRVDITLIDGTTITLNQTDIKNYPYGVCLSHAYGYGSKHLQVYKLDNSSSIKNIKIHYTNLKPQDKFGIRFASDGVNGTSTRLLPTYTSGQVVQVGDMLHFTASTRSSDPDNVFDTGDLKITDVLVTDPNIYPKGVFNAIVSHQLSKTPGTIDAGDLTYESGDSAYGYPQYEHPVMYIKIPENASVNDLSSIHVEEGLTGGWGQPGNRVLTPKSISTIQVGTSTFIKIDLSNYNKLTKGFSVKVNYSNLPDLQTSSDKSAFLIKADNLNDSSITNVGHYAGDSDSSLKNVMDQLISQENIDPAYTTYIGSDSWDILTADGMGSATMTSGNKTVNPTLNGYQDDHGKNADTFNVYGTTINATDMTMSGAVQVINVPSISDGHSQFDSQLTGPVKLVDANTGDDLSNLVTIDYSTDLVDLTQLTGTTISNPMAADQVNDWSKIKSVMIRVKQALPTRTSARAVLTLKDPQVYDHVGKTIYVSNVVYSNDLKPLYIEPGSQPSAKLTVEGQSTITTWVHYKDATGKDQYVQLPDKTKTYNELTDTMNRSDFMSSDTDLTAMDRALLPANLVIDWNSQPTIQNSDNTYLDGYQNGLAEFGKTVKYDFDGDRVVYEASFAKQVTQDKTIKRTIHYKYADGTTAKLDVVQTSKTFTNVGFENLFTNQIKWSQSADNDTLVQVNTPLVAGYTPDKTKVDSVTVNFNSDDVDVTVTYTPDIQHAVVNYIDDTTGETLKTDRVQGNSNSAIDYQTKTQIGQYLNQHYVLVSNDFNDGHENYDHDSSTNQIFNVHLKHGTQAATDDRTKKLLVHYVYASGQPRTGKAHDDQSASDIIFSRIGTTDLVTNTTSWNNWNVTGDSYHTSSDNVSSFFANFYDVFSPVIDGYTPDISVITAQIAMPDSPELIERTVTYKADTQKIIVNYIDDTTGQTLNHDQLTGLSGASANYTTKKLIDGYISQGYDLVSDDTKGQDLLFDTNASVDQVYNVHLKHHLENVSRTSDVNETINYVYAKDGSQAAPQYKAKTISFTQTGVKDHVTNTIAWNNVDPQQFVSVQSPKVDGYTADQLSIPAITVHFGDHDITRTVTYSANTQNLDVVFIDDVTGQTLKTVKKSGSSDTSADYNTKNDISDYEAQHYNLVSDSTNGQSLVFDHNDNSDQHYEVHLSHITHTINETHDINQVIHYLYADGSKAADDRTNSIHFVRDGYYDEVTNTDHWNSWSPSATYDFIAVQSPKIQGFTPDIQTTDQVTVTPSSQNIEQTITYYGDVQLAHVKYIDDSDNGRVMSSDDLSGHTGETDSYTTAKNIKNYTNQGYVFVSDNYPATGVVFDNNDLVDQYFEVHFKHGTVTVTPNQPGDPDQPINPGDPDGPKYPTGTDAKSLQTDVPRTIDYVYQNGKQAQLSISDALHFTETKVIDKVTGKVLSDIWSPTQDFETKITPTIDGYTPDRQAVSNTGIDHAHSAIHEVVTYDPDAQKAVVEYIDDTDQKQLSANDLSGHSDQDSGYNTKSSIDNYIKQHYVLVSDDTNGQNVVYDHDDRKDQVYEVHFKHGTEPANESRTKNLTVHYTYADGLARIGNAADDQSAKSLTFNRTGIKDLVTNEIAWNAWDHTSQTFDEINSPLIAGYTPDQVAINNIDVNADSPALTEKNVIYNADKQKIAINYIDDASNKTLQTINLIGKSDSNSGYITKQAIARYFKQHYDLVSDDTNGEELVFDHDSDVNQVYDVHLTHHTHAINDQVTKSEVVHYVYADGLARKGKAVDDYKATDLTFTRDGYHDEVTGEDHWNDWTPAQQEFVAVKSPEIQGYTADQAEIPVIKMTSGSDNVVRTVTYNADGQKLDVVFIDDTTGKTLSTVTKSGLSDESANYNTKDDIAHYQGLHYNLVSDGTNGQDLIFDHDNDVDQHYEVHLVHATHPISEQTSTKQTIHYQLVNGTKVFDDYTAKVDFSRDGHNDEVTNENHWNKWAPSDTQTFSEVISPVKQGYTSDNVSIAAVNVQPGDKDLEEAVIYTPDEQKTTINYIDDVIGKTLEAKSITGVSDASANYNTKSTIDGYIAEHYKLVSDDTNGDNLVFDHDDKVDQIYNVHLTHTYRNVDNHAAVDETVHYVYDNGQTAHPDYKAQAIEFSRTGTQDLVTKDIVWNAWTPAEQSFTPVATPAINGYTPDIEVVPSVTVNHGSKDVERTVTYHADDQTILVNYIDDDTQSTLKTDTVIGKTAQKSGYTTKKSIDDYLGQHYILVSDETSGENLIFDSDSTTAQVYNVHLKHVHQNVSASDSVNEIIHYIYADGLKAADTVHAPSINFSRTGDKDLVTNEITWNVWTPERQDFAEVKSPVISGYTPSQKVVTAITVKPGDKDVEQTVVYAPDAQSIMVNYIDDVAGKTLNTDRLTGKSDQTSDYSTKTSIDGYENQRYILVSDDTDGKTLTFDHDDQATQVYNVHLSHQTEPVSQSRTVNETIYYVYADGSKAADTFTAKPLAFKQTGVKDLVTGDIDWNGAWTADQTFAQVKSPAITGYTASRIVVDPITVGHDSSDVNQTVIYTANDQTAKINYIDDVTGKTLELDDASGKFGDQIRFDHNVDDQIKKFESQGYKFKSNNFSGQKYQADDSQNEFEVHFTHGTQNVSRTSIVTETVKYQFENGDTAQPDHVQTAEFTQHGVHDLVTKTIVWTPSDLQQFEEVITPKLEGYTPDITNVAAVTIDFGDDDINKVVTYKANTQTADIKYVDDTTDKVLKSDSVTGKFGQAISFAEVPANVINDFVNNGYKFVSSNFNGQTYKADDTKNQFEVHLTHNTENVTRTSDVIRTIKYQYGNGSQAKPNVRQGAHFEQTGVKDLVTGNVDWTDVPLQSFDDVQTPVITGYTPDIANVDVETVNFGDQDQTVIVTYSANDQLAGIKYIDDTTGKTLDNQAASGKFGTLIEFMTDPLIMIQKFENQGYELVLNNFNGQSYQADNDHNQFEVHFKHGTKDVTRTSTVTRTIKYVDGQTGNEVHQPVTQVLTFTENGVTDLVTGDTVWTTSSDQHFSRVQSPDIDGYEQPDIPVVDSDTAKFGDGDQVVEVHYHKVETPSTSNTPDTLDVPDISKIYAIPMTSADQVAQNAQTVSQNIGSHQLQASDQNTDSNANTNQLPQTGNQNDRQLGLIGLVGATFAGLIGFGKKKRHD